MDEVVWTEEVTDNDDDVDDVTVKLLDGFTEPLGASLLGLVGEPSALSQSGLSPPPPLLLLLLCHPLLALL